MAVRRLIAAVVAATVLLAAQAAAAAAAPPTVDKLVAALKASPAYIDPAAQVAPAKARSVRIAARRRASRVRLAVLSGVPVGAASANAAASQVRARLHFNGAVALLSPSGLAVSAPNLGAPNIVRGRKVAAGKKGADALLAFANAVAPLKRPATTPPPSSTTGTSTTGSQPAAKGGGGIPTWIWPVIALAIILLALLGLRTRSRQAHTARGGGMVDAARRLAQARVSDLSHRLTESAVAAAGREDRTVTSHHRQASGIVADVRQSLGHLDGPPDLRRANEALDEAEWHLGMALAHVSGTAEPPRPEDGRPARCFFNATHGLASVEIALEVPGSQSVHVAVCAEDAVRLGRGQDPDVGVVAVGRRTLPWAAAPTWFGGWGFAQDDLPPLRYLGRPVFARGLTLDSLSRPAAPPDDGDEDGEPLGTGAASKE